MSFFNEYLGTKICELKGNIEGIFFSAARCKRVGVFRLSFIMYSFDKEALKKAIKWWMENFKETRVKCLNIPLPNYDCKTPFYFAFGAFRVCFDNTKRKSEFEDCDFIVLTLPKGSTLYIHVPIVAYAVPRT